LGTNSSQCGAGAAPPPVKARMEEMGEWIGEEEEKGNGT